ncbi:MAG: DUF4430 domain-containing protein [Ruminococcus sp.]|nr:DUF4430 domain-containing protein [Ruminococcus sp.]
MKRFSALVILAVILIGGCSVKSAEEYYGETNAETGLRVKISINCENAVKYLKDNKRVNPDILKDCEVGFKKGETVFDALKTACKENKIQFEYNGSSESVYIKGIDYLYEFDCGELSGWEYSVNGEFPSVGCNAVRLNDGDEIKWLYTCDLGADIGNVFKATPHN